MRKPLTIGIKYKFPFIKWIGFREQWDIEKQPYFCLFICKENRTDRVFVI